jgi:Fe-S cluster assembly protein SufB
MSSSIATVDTIRSLSQQKYKYGFVTEIEADEAPPGLDESTVRFISRKKDEPEWLCEWRLAAFRAWQKMTPPNWAKLALAPIDYQAATYYSAPRQNAGPRALDEVDPELLRTYEKLGIPLREQEALAGVAVDAVFDSISVATTFKDKLAELGIVFCSMGEAVREHPDLELSTYFRINAAKSGQFERTLLIADRGSYVSYLEGCTAPQRDENQLHAAVVELIAHEDAQIKYSTVQNWYPGDAEGKGGIYNFVTKRGACRGARSKISWTQVETGSAITWKYPSCILEGDRSPMCRRACTARWSRR